ncbi:MAG: hypothetical protein LQ339_008171 [Xanthoria mediterranea]|nr:MAG: hypothetical protein LQ339_008171 [Xanthoria mediterranea]
MPALQILICGGGCAGPALAYWLARSGHQVTIVERFPALRTTGAQIDIRAQGIQVLKRMGLLDTIRRKLVDEAGVALVDSGGNIKATVLANKSGKGAQSLTSEYEIMRGDLVRVLYDATKDDVTYIFGKTVESFEQDPNNQAVTVHFSDGQIRRYDILVGAEGQSSRIRKAILPTDTDPIKRLGLYLAYWFVPRAETDNNIRKVYHIPSAIIMSRTHSPTQGQAYFSLRDDDRSDDKMRSLPRASTETQQQFWSQRFQGAGWQTDRLLDGMATTNNFYCQEAIQIHTTTWSQGGRVVLLGDAAYCPSPITGMGTTGAFVGAYVLAGEITRHSHNLPLAFAKYDETLRPFVDEMQKFSPTLLRLGYPKTQWGITGLHWIVAVLCFFRIPDLIARFSPAEKAGWRLPDYPEL